MQNPSKPSHLIPVWFLLGLSGTSLLLGCSGINFTGQSEAKNRFPKKKPYFCLPNFP